MEELDLGELIGYFWHKRIYIILITIFAFGVGFFYSAFMQVPKYQSYTTILLTKEDNTTITYTDISLNKSLIDTYSEIIKSKKILKTVIEDLELGYSVNELSKNIGVQSLNDTEIIKITVTDEDAIVAKEIANQIATVFNKQIYNYYSIQNTGIIDEAEVSTSPYNINLVKQTAISTIAGFIASLGIIFIVFYFDTTVKSSDEIEKKLLLPVIGTIPYVGR